MKLETLFLKAAVVLIGIPFVAFFVLALPRIAIESHSDYSAWVFWPFILASAATAIPFFFALFQTFKLLIGIDRNEAFSELSVKALMKIKLCALTIATLAVAELPMFYVIAEEEDAPGVLVIGLLIILGSLVITVFAAVLQKLLKSAIEFKTENDLTV